MKTRKTNSETVQLLTPPEVAKMLVLQTNTLAIWRLTEEHLPFVKIGGLVRYKLSDVLEFIERQTRGGK